MGDTIIDPFDWYRNGLLIKKGESIPYALFRPNNTKTMRILCMHHGNAGCSYHRILKPISHASDYGLVSSSFMEGPTSYDYAKCDIVIFNRVPTVKIEELLEARKKFGFKIITDIDDHWILYPHHEMAEAWKKSGAHEQIQQCIIEADMVFTTNERLNNAALTLNKNSHVVPNGLTFGHGQFNRLTNIVDYCGGPKKEKVEFVYAAGSSHLHDLSVIKPTLKRLGSDGQFKRDAIIKLAGYESRGVGAFDGVWDKMLKILSLCGSYEVIAKKSMHEYMLCYSTANVALAPLEKSDFNACKSNLKILEAGCMGIPIIASNVEPYIQDKECPGVILCETQREWYDAIKRLTNNRTLAKELGLSLAAYVRKKYNLYDINLRTRLPRLTEANSIKRYTGGVIQPGFFDSFRTT